MASKASLNVSDMFANPDPLISYTLNFLLERSMFSLILFPKYCGNVFELQQRGICFRAECRRFKLVSFTANTLSNRGSWEKAISLHLPWMITKIGFLDTMIELEYLKKISLLNFLAFY